IEARVPFLDHELYDGAKRIPVDFKMRDGVEKAVLRDAAKDILPEDLRLRRKRGFMLTSGAVDFFGEDRPFAKKWNRYLEREAFERSQVFSYAAYWVIRLLARIPRLRVPVLKRLRRFSNQAIIYIVETHMLHEMFIDAPRWEKRDPAQSGKNGAKAYR